MAPAGALAPGRRWCVLSGPPGAVTFALPPDPAPRFGILRPVKARVHVTLKPGILDPQGKAIQHALGALGFGAVGKVRQGKVIDLEIAETDPEAAARPDSGAVCCDRSGAGSIERRGSRNMINILSNEKLFGCGPFWATVTHK